MTAKIEDLCFWAVVSFTNRCAGCKATSQSDCSINQYERYGDHQHLNIQEATRKIINQRDYNGENKR